jgi:hypothetical protein
MIAAILQSFPDVLAEQLVFARLATSHLQDMVNNPTFLDRLKTVTYTRNIYFPNNKYQIEATNADLLRVITGGAEWQVNPGSLPPDHEIDINARLETFPTGILGGANHPDPTIRTSATFFESWRQQNDWLSLAGHWFHEWLHVAGFQHAFRAPGVPPDFGDAVYTVGYLLIRVEQERVQQLTKSSSPVALGEGYVNAYRSAA